MTEKTLGQVARDAWYRHRPCAPDDWQAVADAVVAAHEERRWKAIESAPKESEERIAAGIEPRCPILQLVVGGEVMNGYFDLYYAAGGRGYSGGSGWCNQAGEEINEPTHWTPIPAPPKEGE